MEFIQANSGFLLFFFSALIYSLFGWFLLARLRYCAPPGTSSSVKKTVSIIIPARNEAERLPKLLESLAREDAFSRFQVILADDGSTDATGRLAEEAGCRVIRITDKPEEAQGKSWACWQAAQKAEGDLLLFLDADTWFTDGGLEAVLSHYRGGLMSVQPYHRFRKVYESFSAFFNVMSMAGTGSFHITSRPGNAYGCFGPCLLCSRGEYFTIGGHDAVKNRLVDDVALAWEYRKAGLPIYNFAGKGAVEYRMYPEGVPALVEGWAKNMSLASAKSSPAVAVFFGIWCAGFANLFITIGVMPGSPARYVLALVLYLYYTLQVLSMLHRIGSWSFFHALLFPFYLIFFIFILLLSVYKTRRKKNVTWRGREINIGKE